MNDHQSFSSNLGGCEDSIRHLRPIPVGNDCGGPYSHWPSVSSLRRESTAKAMPRCEKSVVAKATAPAIAEPQAPADPIENLAIEVFTGDTLESSFGTTA